MPMRAVLPTQAGLLEAAEGDVRARSAAGRWRRRCRTPAPRRRGRPGRCRGRRSRPPGRTGCRWPCGSPLPRSRTSMIGSTGPKVSSCITSMSGVALAMTVGWIEPAFEPCRGRCCRCCRSSRGQVGLATGQHRAALGDRVLDVLLDLARSPSRRSAARPACRGSGRCRPSARGQLGDLLRRTCRRSTLDVEAVGADAGLPGVAEARGDHRLRRPSPGRHRRRR